MSENKDLYKLFESNIFKSEMDINIKHILLNNEKSYTFELNLNENECYTDGNKIIIGAIEEFSELDENEIYILVKGLVGHEASHVRWSNFTQLSNFINSLKYKFDLDFIHSIVNSLEDSRIEDLLTDELPGFKKYLRYMNYKLIYNNGYIKGEDFKDKILNLIIYISKINKVPINYKTIFSSSELIYSDKITNLILSGFHKKSSQHIYECTKEILYILNKFNSINKSYIQYEAINTCLEINNIEYNTNNQKPNQNDFKTELNALEGISSFEIESIISSTKKEFEDLKILFNKESVTQTSKIDYFDISTDLDIEKINMFYSKELQELNFKYSIMDFSPVEYPLSISYTAKNLERNFKNIFETKNTSKFNQKFGKIDNRKLWKSVINLDSNIFKKDKRPITDNYGIYILIDMSSSMSLSNKYIESINTAMTIEKSLLNINNVYIKTVGFNYTDRSNMFIFKDFNESLSRLPHAIKKDYANGCNRDGFAIKVALEDLNKNNFKNKLLIIISDGRPMWDKQTAKEAMTDVKNTVHEGRKNAIISSILINDGPINPSIRKSFTYMYEDKGSIAVDVRNNPNELLNSIIININKIFKYS